MTAQVKPWKSIHEQLEILRSRGLRIEDDDRAKRYLTRLGYYRLSGYWYPFRQFRNVDNGQTAELRCDDFMEGSGFGDLVKLYVFDKKLRLLAQDALERIEMALRVDVAHLLGESDALAHENPDYFHGNFGKKISLKSGKPVISTGWRNINSRSTGRGIRRWLRTTWTNTAVSPSGLP